ncbi:MAG: hypothetical protein AUG48_04775 [Actinobacteria bacterium 13_1_20CM_3_68_9]|nr:MAG: hypothetical protein AUG48_04775 [Actinobacteria bacterium 13_1_20CM_3_68_9]
MKGRGWIALGAVALLVVVLVMLRGGGGQSRSPEHASTSDAVDGTSALRAFADALGHASGSVEGEFSLPSSSGLLFVFTPTDGFGADEVQKLNGWIHSGGVVVYAAEDGDPQLDIQFGLRRSTAGVPAKSHADAPIFGGVETVAGADKARAFAPTSSQVALLRNDAGDVLGVRQAVGQGQLVALTDPLILCNGFIGQADNGRLAADLVAMTPTGGRVWFDEFHHGAAASGSTETAWMTTPWGLALLGAVVIIFAGLALRGRPFGPQISLRAGEDRSTAEYAVAVGSLLHRTGARQVTLQALLAATRRAVAQRIGLGSDVSSDRIDAAIAQRAPAAAAELSRAEHDLEAAGVSEAEVLKMARRLHDLAYPLSQPEGMKESA